MDQKITTPGGITLAYRELGDPRKPPLTLLHGRTANHHDWNTVIHPLAQHHHVRAVTLRGHGDSSRPGTYHLPDMADDIVAFLDATTTPRTALIGHSLGGMIAYHLAARHPGRLTHLILEDPPAPLPVDRPPLTADDDATGYDTAMLHQTEHQFTHPDPGWAAALHRIATPTLVIAGGPTSHVDAAATAALIPTAHTVTIDAGHLIHQNAPRQFLQTVLTFLT
ncbi:alpha/beta hydrolase [Nonomuraea longicatena]|uniref:AB hydrolase-1 domain-containing protein n=1 Tax=Nonomuraea longicatena TaxID=83682 RepID=A0ABP4BLE2_9ACTN